MGPANCKFFRPVPVLRNGPRLQFHLLRQKPGCACLRSLCAPYRTHVDAVPDTTVPYVEAPARSSLPHSM
jgi:hypothetical protein